MAVTEEPKMVQCVLNQIWLSQKSQKINGTMCTQPNTAVTEEPIMVQCILNQIQLSRKNQKWYNAYSTNYGCHRRAKDGPICVYSAICTKNGLSSLTAMQLVPKVQIMAKNGPLCTYGSIVPKMVYCAPVSLYRGVQIVPKNGPLCTYVSI